MRKNKIGLRAYRRSRVQTSSLGAGPDSWSEAEPIRGTQRTCQRIQGKSDGQRSVQMPQRSWLHPRRLSQKSPATVLHRPVRLDAGSLGIGGKAFLVRDGSWLTALTSGWTRLGVSDSSSRRYRGPAADCKPHP